MTLDYTKSFIEEQFPVSKLSKESFKERKAGGSQTLTGLGKWWGRKPLVLVRAVTLGSLLPVSDDKQKDKDVFLKLMGMDDASLKERKYLSLSTEDIYNSLTVNEQDIYFDFNNGKAKWKTGIKQNEKDKVHLKVFNSLSYDNKLNYCVRPEHMSLLSEEDWNFINSHLETNANHINDLVEQLSIRRFGHKVKIGDCFVGGGSNIFEPARLGCDVYGSDLNPVAGLLTWASLNILGCSNTEKTELMIFQDKLFDYVTEVVDNLKLEINSKKEFSKYYLYCYEALCLECKWKVPILPSLKISDKAKIGVKLIENNNECNFNFELLETKSDNEYEENEKNITLQGGYLVCPHCGKKTSISSIRGGDNNSNLRKWKQHEWKNSPTDIYSERLYAIQYIHFDNEPDFEKYNIIRKNIGNCKAVIDSLRDWHPYYKVPDDEDLCMEKAVNEYLEKNFNDWQEKGYIPSMEIYGGYNQDQPIRERGFQYWFQLFNPRQLVFLALFNEAVDKLATTPQEMILGIIMMNKFLDSNSKLSAWNKSRDIGVNTFLNQAINTLFNYSTRSSFSVYSVMKIDIENISISSKENVFLKDAKDINEFCDIWITDPPYADAVNYEELTEFFSSWDGMLIKKAFPTWYADSKRVLAIKGVGKSFNEAMVDVYRNLANHMPDNGYQLVMFTHQDTQVWAELAMILWSAGLQVTSAWCIQTETNAGFKQGGNYVQGTVVMVLKKQASSETIFKDELYEEIRDEVKKQIDTMRDLDNGDNQDFNDGDYLLAAYVAALKILTSYKKISGIDVQYELEKARDSKDDSPVTKLIETAKKEAYDYLVPSGISPSVWRVLIPEERFYIKGFELELNGNMKLGSFQEIARGFGINNYDEMFASKRANQVRLKTPSEYKDNGLDKDDFGKSILRHILKAIHIATNNESAVDGRNYLKAEYEEGNQYWTLRNRIVELLSFLGQAKNKANMEYWKNDAEYILILREAIKNDSI